MRKSARLRAASGALLLVAGLGALVACGDDTTATSDDSQGPVDVGTAGASGTTAASGQDLPDGFPTDDIPLLDETIVSATAGPSGGPFAWSVVMQSSRSVEDLADEVQHDFGTWDSQSGDASSMGDLSIQRFRNDAYDVGVTIARSGGSVAITYLVKDAG